MGAKGISFLRSHLGYISSWGGCSTDREDPSPQTMLYDLRQVP